MGRDCTIWSLDLENGEMKSHGLDRLFVFDHVEPPAKNHFCERFINRVDSLCWIGYLTKHAYRRDWPKKNPNLEYHLHWIKEARDFIDCSEHRFNAFDFWFTIVEEESDPMDRRKDYAEAVVRAQWPRCPHCQFPEGHQKKADRWSEYSVGLFKAECSHMGRAEKSIWECQPVALPKWILDAALPAYGEKFDQPMSKIIDVFTAEQEEALIAHFFKRGAETFEYWNNFFKEPDSETLKRLREYTEPL